ncbi:hypothetical protein JW921_03360 [Candidatus Fermentibacterales bacterium]|nr:hypothetical protein [Candidatus Fermentibacterales bacterium]
MQTVNKLVAHYKDGRVFKGFTRDFVPAKPSFHLASVANQDFVKEIVLDELKALFFVKDFSGDPSYEPKQDFSAISTAPGKKLKVKFQDGEVLLGTTQAFHRDKTGFFLYPADPACNIQRAFVINSALESVEIIGQGT